MDIGLILISGSVAIGVISWLIGFMRAAKRQPINDRLAAYCQR